jgi:magnesium-transporting ATPase (P-type)
MKEFVETKETLLKQLGSDMFNGLDERRIEANRQKYGANELTRQRPASLIPKLTARLFHMSRAALNVYFQYAICRAMNAQALKLK